MNACPPLFPLTRDGEGFKFKFTNPSYRFAQISIGYQISATARCVPSLRSDPATSNGVQPAVMNYFVRQWKAALGAVLELRNQASITSLELK